MEAAYSYIIDLTKIDGEGDVPCPLCGTILSPEDETETTYKILETKLKNDSLEGLVLLCKKCGSKIHLVGFLTQ